MENKISLHSLLIILFLLVLIPIFIFLENKENGAVENILSISLNGNTFDLELAKTLEEKSRGLSFRENLLENQGMIFVYDDEKERSFWMMDTLIPLDVIFLDSAGKIIEIKENMQPCEESLGLGSCKPYNSLPTKYVIEINAGLCNRLGLKVGEVINLNQNS